MKRTDKQSKKYFTISLLFLTSLVSIGASALFALAGSATPAIVLVAAGLSLLTVSLVSVLVITLRESRQGLGKAEPLNNVEKAGVAVGFTEILLWIFLAP